MTIVVDDAGHWLAALAAQAYARARAAGCPAGITSAGRTGEEQRDLFLARYAPSRTGAVIYNGVRYTRRADAGSAAVPGTSKHEAGTALDLPAGGPREWMTAHGAYYGWLAGRVAGEPWHFEYEATADRSLAGTGITTRPIPIEETDMIVIRQTSTGKTFTAAPGLLKHHGDGEQARVALALARQAAPLELSDDDLRRAVWDLGLDNGVDPVARLKALPHGGVLSSDELLLLSLERALAALLRA